MKNKKSWLIVVNKKTYLFLLSIPLAIVYIVYQAINTFSQPNPMIMDFVIKTAFALFVVLLCVTFFVKFNTYSHWMNPDHPKPDK